MPPDSAATWRADLRRTGVLVLVLSWAVLRGVVRRVASLGRTSCPDAFAMTFPD